MQQQQQQVARRRPRVPVGYRFTPSPEELIRFYLNPWVLNAGKTATNLFPGDVVCVADIYAADPDALTSRFRHAGHDGCWYFLCVSRWKCGRAGTRTKNRCVQGGGTWHGSGKRRPVGREGYRQGFEYRAAAAAGNGRKTAWIMEEFVSNLEAAADGEGVKVICKVYRSPRAPAALDVVVEQEIKKVVGFKRPYIAGTSHQSAAADAGVKRARLDGEHGLAACSTSAAPSPTEHYAGTSSQGALVESPADSATTWQQSMMEPGMGVVDGEPGPLVPVVSAGMERLPLPPMEYGGLDVTALNAPLVEEWWASPDFYTAAT